LAGWDRATTLVARLMYDTLPLLNFMGTNGKRLLKIGPVEKRIQKLTFIPRVKNQTKKPYFGYATSIYPFQHGLIGPGY